MKGRHPHIAFRCHNPICKKKLYELSKAKPSSLSIVETQLLGRVCKPIPRDLFCEISAKVGLAPRHLPPPSMILDDSILSSFSRDALSRIGMESSKPAPTPKTFADDLSDFASLLQSFGN
jgi:hypothetical protein